MAASIQGGQGVELTIVQDLYGVQGIFSTLQILLNKDPQICNSCKHPVPNLAEGCAVSMEDGGKESYGNHEGGSLQCSCVEDIRR